jgi:hypothetical protein
MNRVLFQPNGARVGFAAAESAPLGRTDVRFGWQAAGVRIITVFSRRVFNAANGMYPFFVDYAGGKRSLARVCFYRLRTVAFHLATSRSRTGRP